MGRRSQTERERKKKDFFSPSKQNFNVGMELKQVLNFEHIVLLHR
jgi:hypothetical protein